MARPSIFCGLTPKHIAQIASRPSWPPALLADVLGCSRASIYRRFPGPHPIETSAILAAIEHGRKECRA